MSQLKYMSKEELLDEIRYCDKRIVHHKSHLGGQLEKMRWLNHYLYLIDPTLRPTASLNPTQEDDLARQNVRRIKTRKRLFWNFYWIPSLKSLRRKKS